MMGKLVVNMPNNNQSNVPTVNKVYITSDMPLVFFVLIILIACGKKEIVVQMAAT
jgi:hypothetical protein